MNIKKNIITFFIIIGITFTVFGSGKKENLQNTKPSSSQMRIVSLAPNVTEIIFALGKEKNLVGRTNYCNFPPEASEIVSIGEMMDPNIEKIIELKPDIVLASTHAQKDVAAKIEKLGIRLQYLYYDSSLEGVFSAIETIGAMLEAKDEANNLILDIKKRYDKVKQKAEILIKKPTVYYVVGFGVGGEWSAGGNTFIGQIIKAAGGDNIASEIKGWSYSLEKLIQADPNIILISGSMYNEFVNKAPYSELSAVKNKKIYIINEDLFNRPGPRIIEGVELLNELFTKE